jgi:hypothetical protein
LRRLERTAVVFVVIGTLVGGAVGGISWAGGILGGGILAAISYWAIRSSVDALVQAKDAPRPMTRLVVALVGRHALLGLAAYVIIVRLRLHPVGVLIGASAVVLAAAREAVRGRPQG